MKRVTARDVAAKAGVSQSTISLVFSNDKANISEETKARVLSAAQDLGYKYTPSKKNSAHAAQNMIAIVVPNLFYPFHLRMIELIERTAVSKGYSTLVCNIDTPESERFYTRLFLNNVVKGVVFAFTPNNNTIIDTIRGNLPSVILGEKDDDIDLDTFSINSHQAGIMIVDHLLECGHSHIAFISNTSEAASRATRRRLEGIRYRLRQLDLEDNLVYLFKEGFLKEDGSMDSAYALTKKLLTEHPEVTAIIAQNDLTSMGVMDALRDMSIEIPDQMAVCSFDDTYLSRATYPKITTIEHGIYLRVQFAFDLLVEQILNPKLSRPRYKSLSEPTLIIRGSTVKGKDKKA